MKLSKEEIEEAGLTIRNNLFLDEGFLLGVGEEEERIEREGLPAVVSYEEERMIKTAPSFYIIPILGIAIPSCNGAHEILVEELVKLPDYTGAQDLAEYPVISEYHLRNCFPSYRILPHRSIVRVTKPLWTCDERARERAKRQYAETRVISKWKKEERGTLSVEIDI